MFWKRGALAAVFVKDESGPERPTRPQAIFIPRLS
jgi:hypothetical protein